MSIVSAAPSAAHRANNTAWGLASNAASKARATHDERRATTEIPAHAARCRTRRALLSCPRRRWALVHGALPPRRIPGNRPARGAARCPRSPRPDADPRAHAGGRRARRHHATDSRLRIARHLARDENPTTGRGPPRARCVPGGGGVHATVRPVERREGCAGAGSAAHARPTPRSTGGRGRDAGAPPPAVTRSARRKAEHPLAGQSREFRPARCPLEGKRRRGTEALTRGAAYAPNSGTAGQAGPRAAAPEIRGGIDAVVRCRWGRGARPSRTAIAGAGIAPRSRPLGLRPRCQSVRAAATGAPGGRGWRRPPAAAGAGSVRRSPRLVVLVLALGLVVIAALARGLYFALR